MGTSAVVERRPPSRALTGARAGRPATLPSFFRSFVRSFSHPAAAEEGRLSLTLTLRPRAPFPPLLISLSSRPRSTRRGHCRPPQSGGGPSSPPGSRACHRGRSVRLPLPRIRLRRRRGRRGRRSPSRGPSPSPSGPLRCGCCWCGPSAPPGGTSSPHFQRDSGRSGGSAGRARGPL